MEATRLIAGDTIDFVVTVQDYPATDGWTLKYRLVPRASAGSAIVLLAVAQGTDYRIQADPMTTSAWAAGEYAWSSWVEKVGARQIVRQGQLTIAPDPATASPGTDTRSSAETALTAIDAYLANRANDGAASYRIADRELRRYTISELMSLRAMYVSEVQRERKAAGLVKNGGGTIRVRFA